MHECLHSQARRFLSVAASTFQRKKVWKWPRAFLAHPGLKGSQEDEGGDGEKKRWQREIKRDRETQSSISK